jgi:hypothetical protein
MVPQDDSTSESSDSGTSSESTDSSSSSVSSDSKTSTGKKTHESKKKSRKLKEKSKTSRLIRRNLRTAEVTRDETFLAQQVGAIMKATFGAAKKPFLEDEIACDESIREATEEAELQLPRHD